ncbi:MAG: murein biosynthesis integral membrane protein MurJ, partial [Candidatus Eremiobacteraeota bacterium]|nr:murein biosynthesis integral membrane protein MurJ [Candidatus Eremiobacteraeota bacterium]
MAATLGSTVLGFGREMVNARYFGAHEVMDTFLAAATIPTILFGAFNGALLSALIPTFSNYIARNEEKELWRLASTIINVLLITLGAGAVAGWFLAPYYVPFIAHGFVGGQLVQTIEMTRWLMPTIIATSLAGVISALLNAYHRFSATAIQGIAINVVTIACVTIWFHKMGIFALVLGTAFGLVAQLLVQLPAFFTMRRFRLLIDIRHPGFALIASRIGPILVGSAAGQMAMFFDRYFSSTLSHGYMAGMNYAVKLVNFPQQIFAAAIATVLFPLFASQYARDNFDGVRRTLSMGLRVVFLVMIPAVCGLFVLNAHIVKALFERGAFQASATQLTAGLLPFAVVGLFALAANVVLTRCAFACNETRYAVGISIFSVVANVVLSLIWLPSLGARGLLLANSVSQSLQAILLLILVWKVVGGLEWQPIVRSILGVTASSTIMVFGLRWIALLEPQAASGFVQTEFLIGQMLIGAVLF